MAPVVRELARLIAYPTVSHRPVDALAAYVAERHEGRGFRIERFADPSQPGKYNVVASIGPAGTDGLVISGHMDVVPTEGQPWTSDPFALTERDGRLHGRGSADMKGFIAATLAALDRIPKDAFRRELSLVWTYDEEIGCFGSARLAEAMRRDGRTLPKACLIGEPTDFRILRMHPGHVAIEIEIVGRAAHSSRPQLGVNAIEVAAALVRDIRAVIADLDRLRTAAEPDPWVPVNVARIEGGKAVNIVPDSCVLTIGYRPPPGMAAELPYEKICERLRAVTEPIVAEYGVPPARARIVRITPSMLTREGTPLQATLARHAHDAEHTGMAPFATDGGNLASLGLEPLVFGPGSIEVAHKADEYVAAADLERAVDVVEAIIRERCATTG